jgi:hypothetical protein
MSALHRTSLQARRKPQGFSGTGRAGGFLLLLVPWFVKYSPEGRAHEWRKNPGASQDRFWLQD